MKPKIDELNLDMKEWARKYTLWDMENKDRILHHRLFLWIVKSNFHAQ